MEQRGAVLGKSSGKAFVLPNFVCVVLDYLNDELSFFVEGLPLCDMTQHSPSEKE